MTITATPAELDANESFLDDTYSFVRQLEGSRFDFYIDSLNDKIVGSSKNNLIDAYTGNDILYGNVGNDRLYGNQGDDFLDGGVGNDLIDGGDGIDTALAMWQRLIASPILMRMTC